MSVLSLSDSTWQNLEKIDKTRAVAVLPIGAIEAHGPHLGLMTDAAIAEAMASDGAVRLSTHGFEVVMLPCLYFTPAPFAAGFSGTVSTRISTAAAMIEDIGLAVSGWGIRAFAVANAHFDPANLRAIRDGLESLRSVLEYPVFPDVTKKPWAGRLTAEFRSGACHAGRYETSIVMATRPEMVRTDIADRMFPNDRSLSVAIKEGKQDFREAGGPLAYFGDPAKATAAEGRESIGILGQILCDAVVNETGWMQ